MGPYISINKVFLVGRLSQDPDLKEVEARGKTILMARFTVVTNEAFRDLKTKKYVIKPEWHAVIAWGKRAEFVGDNIKKGRLVIVDGKLKHSYYNDEDGNKRKLTQVEVENIITPTKADDFEVPEVKEKEEQKEDPF